MLFAYLFEDKSFFLFFLSFARKYRIVLISFLKKQATLQTELVQERWVPLCTEGKAVEP